MQMSYRRLNEFIGKRIQCLGIKETPWQYRLFQIFTKSKIANEQPMSQFSRSISMVRDGKFFEKGFISESKFLNESTPSGQKILPKVPL